ncbi:hypothetical protein ACGK9R_15305 [Halomonas sp. HNIBRBA4712]|uniref:hypothetical protein n=1 Tax=Halomonas sp. HNIBRBA4712 TaxID=3373087 RepID=UPI003746F15A
MTAIAPVVTLAEPCTLLETDRVTISYQKLLFDGQSLSAGVLLHRRVAPRGVFAFIIVPADHLLVLDLDDTTIARLHQATDDDHSRYTIAFNSERHALAYLIKH